MSNPLPPTPVSGADGAVELTAWAMFRLGNARLAVPAERAFRFMDLGATAPIPLAPPAVLGVANAGGKLITVLDVALLVGLPPSGAARARHCLVVTVESDFVGLAAEVLEGVVEVRKEAVRGVGADGRGLVAGSFEYQGHLVTLLDVDRLVTSIETVLSKG